MARCHVTIATRQVWKFETDGTTLRCNDSFKNVDEGVAVGAGALRLVRVVGTITNVLGIATNMEIAIMVAYPLVLFLHVLAAMVWVGATVVMTVVRVRAARGSGLEADGLALQLNQLVKPTVARPAMMLTVIAGLSMVAIRRHMDHWAGWGLVVSLGYVLLTLIFLSRFERQLAALRAGPEPDSARQRALRRRAAAVALLNVLLLVSAVWAMVYKPTF